MAPPTSTSAKESSTAARVYFDWNSTTPPLPEALAAMMSAYEGAWGNPSSVHAEGRAARARLDDARRAIAELVGARPADVVMTSGGTEASNIALCSPFMGDRRGALVLADIEHASILSVADALADAGVEVRKARVSRSGVVDVADVARLVAEGGVRLVTVQAVNGETGVIQPIEEVCAIAHEHGAVAHVDAIQAIGRVEAPPGGWLAHADTLSLAAHKMRGPKGIGALVTRPGHRLRPVLRGGSQERGLRPGTQDAALAAGFAVAARAAMSTVASYLALQPLRERFERAVLAAAAGAAVNGEALRVPHVSHLSFPGWSSPELVAALDLDGVSASGGPACHAGVAEPSATLAAMWRDYAGEHWRLQGPIRFSLPPWTTSGDVDRAVDVVRRVTARRSDAAFGG